MKVKFKNLWVWKRSSSTAIPSDPEDHTDHPAQQIPVFKVNVMDVDRDTDITPPASTPITIKSSLNSSKLTFSNRTLQSPPLSSTTSSPSHPKLSTVSAATTTPNSSPNLPLHSDSFGDKETQLVASEDSLNFPCSDQ